MLLNKIYIMKDSGTTANISLNFNDDDNDYLTIDGIVVDLSDSASPVRSMKINGQEIIRGPLFDQYIPLILDSFMFIKDESNGLYIADEDSIEKG